MASFRKILLSLAALICLPAMAEFTTVAEAYEVALNDFTAPASAHGVVAFKPCGECALQSVRVTPDTRYVLNKRDVRLQEFRNAVAGVTNRDTAGVTVMHHLASDTVTSISITL
jgi:hypothetical protein